MSRLFRLEHIVGVLLVLQGIHCFAAASNIVINDNIRPAGQQMGNLLTVGLYAAIGRWQPESPQKPAIEVAAFGEEGQSLSVPAPLLRVREGTAVVLTLRNSLPSTLYVTGLCTRPGPCDSVSVDAGASREIRLTLNQPGTFFYWASTAAGPMTNRSSRDTQLGGAIVVDPQMGSPPDRVLVISTFGDPPPPLQPRASEADIFTINGRSWPHTEKLHHKVGDTVVWRIVNLSFLSHAMHLHGFYFNVTATGDLSTERRPLPDQRRMVVTELVASANTFEMSWSPERPGNWLFHCHMTAHMSAPGREGQPRHSDHDHAAGMGGMVLGIQVAGKQAAATHHHVEPRRFSLVLREEVNRYGNQPGYRVDVEGSDAPRLNSGPVPGPLLVLVKGEPVEIGVVNQMSEPSAIHWHGIELDSYFDGVPGWGGQAGRISPPVLPGETFVAKFTPPRAGTFIYHTHWHKDAQLAGGLYGAIVVVEPGQRYDPKTDHVIVIGLNGVLRDNESTLFVLNGRSTPEPIVMREGVPNRIRLINITANGVALWTFLSHGAPFGEATWKPVAKDGADLPPAQTVSRPARQLIGVGEAYDFEIVPSRAKRWWLEVRRPDGGWLMQAPIRLQ